MKHSFIKKIQAMKTQTILSTMLLVLFSMCIQAQGKMIWKSRRKGGFFIYLPRKRIQTHEILRNRHFRVGNFGGLLHRGTTGFLPGVNTIPWIQSL
ncbi:hypothetical protein EF405_05290 [Cyclobacteriaceae bacterium YHN15]|nr:hypothetical protein EF405_05290 [Cyclobacteriaceae bacterium YHN15]